MRGKASWFAFLPDGEIVEVVATGGIDDFEIDGGVEKGCVPQVRGKHGSAC